ncbi:MAG: GGDEF domain-containing protein [Burkholderiaceae bacterium]|nr:GGDEF domain-containing protein [Burkholderiaceae bacterium]
MMNGSTLFLDQLTGLPNRACFLDRLSEAADDARAHRRALALLVIDLDNLFLINLEKGRHAGDQALIALAQTLRRSARTNDFVARLGGDQFAMLLPGTSLTTAAQLASAIRSLVGRAHEVHPGFGMIDVCIGVSARPSEDGWRAQDLLDLADLRLTSAKRSRHRPGTPQHVWAGPPDPMDDDDEAQ